jgi:hypothetical protein
MNTLRYLGPTCIRQYWLQCKMENTFPSMSLLFSKCSSTYNRLIPSTIMHTCPYALLEYSSCVKFFSPFFQKADLLSNIIYSVWKWIIFFEWNVSCAFYGLATMCLLNDFLLLFRAKKDLYLQEFYRGVVSNIFQNSFCNWKHCL